MRWFRPDYGQPQKIEYFLRVSDLSKGPIGIENGGVLGGQNIRSLTPQAAVRRFIKKRLGVMLVLRDDGMYDHTSAIGGEHSWMGTYTKPSAGRRFQRMMMRGLSLKSRETHRHSFKGLEVVFA